MKKYYRIVGDKAILTKRQLKIELDIYKSMGYKVKYEKVEKL